MGKRPSHCGSERQFECRSRDWQACGDQHEGFTASTRAPTGGGKGPRGRHAVSARQRRRRQRGRQWRPDSAAQRRDLWIPGDVVSLAQHGAKEGQPDKDVRTPLQRVVQHDNEAIINALLEHGADAEGLATFSHEHSKTSSTGFTCTLSPAAARDAYIQTLLPSSRIRELHKAVLAGDVKQVQSILSRPLTHVSSIVNAIDTTTHRTAIFSTARYSQLGVLKALVRDLNADPNIACGAKKDTALMTAMLPTAKTLLETGRDNVKLDATDKDGRTILHVTTGRTRENVIRFILERSRDLRLKFDVNKRDVFRQTPLMLAARSGNAAVVEMLLKMRSDDKEGRTADSKDGELEGAQNSGDKNIKDERHGAGMSLDLRAEDTKGRTALAWAQKKGYTEIEEMLRLALGLDGQGEASERGANANGEGSP